MATPEVNITVADPGLGVVEAAPDAPLVLATAETGDILELGSFGRKQDVLDEHGEGTLTQAVCRILDIDGGPVRAMRLPSSTPAVIGAVTTTRVGASTGTIAVSIPNQDAARAWQIDDPAGTPVFVEETTDLADVGAGDVDPWPAGEAAGDQFAIGFDAQFSSLSITIGTSGTVGTMTVRYWDGTAWVVVAGLVDGTTNLTAAPGTYNITWTMPTNWQRRSLNSTEPLYYVVFQVAGLYTINPVLSEGHIRNHGGFDDHDAQVEILTTGTLGAGVFRYSLDNGESFSEPIVIPTAGLFDIEHTGLRLTFTAGAGPTFFEDGDLFEFTVTAPLYSTADVSAAVTALLGNSTLYPTILMGGRPASAADAATLLAALDVHAATFRNANRFVQFIMDFGRDTVANTQTQLNTVASRDVIPCYGTCDVLASRAYSGNTFPARALAETVAALDARELISTDLARFATGPMPGVIGVSHDELLEGEPLDAYKISTARTHLGASGFYLTNARVKSPAGSDFRYRQHRRVINEACRVVFNAQQNFLSIGIRVNSDGTIDERDALRLERIVNRQLQAALTQPTNAEGTPGHVSSVSYAIDRTNNIVATETLLSVVAVVPLGYAKQISTVVGFALSGGGS